MDDLSGSTALAFDMIDRYSRAHYRGLSADNLIASLNTPLGRRQYARLLGVMVKDPFAESIPRRPSQSTEAVIALRWRDDRDLRRLAPGTWQFSMMRALIDSEGGGAPIDDDDALAQLSYYKYETSLAKFIFQAFRKRICGDEAASKKVQAAINEAKKSGVVITTPTASRLSVGIASTVAVTVAGLMPASVAAVGAPVIGGIALLLIQVGVDGFCEWSKTAIEEADAIENSEM